MNVLFEKSSAELVPHWNWLLTTVRIAGEVTVRINGMFDRTVPAEFKNQQIVARCQFGLIEIRSLALIVAEGAEVVHEFARPLYLATSDSFEVHWSKLGGSNRLIA